MKLVGMLRKLCWSSCVKAKEQNLLNGLAIDEPAGGTSAFNSRATFAEATAASATAAGSLAVLAIGGLAVGFLVIGRLIIREMLIQQVHLHRSQDRPTGGGRPTRQQANGPGRAALWGQVSKVRKIRIWIKIPVAKI